MNEVSIKEPKDKSKFFLTLISKEIIINVYSKDTDKLLFNETIDLNEIYFISKTLKNENFPINTILLEFEQGFYMSYNQQRTLKSKISSELKRETISSKTIDTNEFEKALIKFISLKYTTFELESIQEKRKKDLEERFLKEKDAILKNDEIELLKAEYTRLENKMKVDKEFYERRKNELVKKQLDIENKTKELEEGKRLLEIYKKNYDKEYELEMKEEKEMIDVEIKLKERRKILTKDILNIYPINQTKLGYNILGVYVTKNNQINLDEESATALGYIAHSLRMISNIYSIPLKYSVIPCLSRSFIKDDTQTPFPLFFQKGQEKTKFFKGISLLNTNILQLLTHHQYIEKFEGKLRDPAYIIENLLFLIEWI